MKQKSDPKVFRNNKKLDRIYSIKNVISRLKKLYFHERLIRGEFYNLHLKRCKNYFLINKLRDKGLEYKEIENSLHLPMSTIVKYINKSKPYLYCLASSIPRTIVRKGYRLLPLHSKRGGHSYNTYIRVPMKIQNYSSIVNILKQLTNREQNFAEKEKSFAYVLGMLVSDASKPKGYRFSNQFLLCLTRKYDWSLKIGEYTCKCFNFLGFKAHRIKDDKILRKNNPNGHYRWITEKSPFITFLLKTCLGLKDGEVTTYDSVKMKWLFSAPKHFIISFLQGVFDGDGSAHNFWKIELSCEPNQMFFIELLKSLDIKSYIDGDAIVVSNEKSILIAYDLPIFLCAEGRIEKLKKLKNKIENRVYLRDVSETVRNIILKLKRFGLSGGEVSEVLFDKFCIGLNPHVINDFYNYSTK